MIKTSLEIISDVVKNQTSADYLTTKKFLHAIVYNPNKVYPSDKHPVVYIISGGISAGKSTLSYNFLKHFQKVDLPFLGNDTIHEVYFENQGEIFDFNYNKARDFTDNAIALLIKNHSSFIWETVFSKDKKIDALKSLKDNNYKIVVLHVGTELETALRRNKIREQLDGNIVENDFIKDRYEKVIRYFPTVMSFADETYIFSNEERLELLLAKNDKENYRTQNMPTWATRLIDYEA